MARRILHVASEVAPFAMSGGLADVVAGLPRAQARAGHVVGVLVPFYRGVGERVASENITFGAAHPLDVTVGVHHFAAHLRVFECEGVRYGFVDLPALFDRPGTLYGPGGSGEWSDNHLRFAALGAAARSAGPLLLGGEVDVLHVHDWQGGPAALYARLADKPPRIVATIHNLAYRGIFPKSAMTELGLPWSLFTPGQLEFYDQISFLKGALAAADVVTTVSPTYAKEILTPAFGEALDGFLVHDVERVVGIVNGIDTDTWDPATDRALPAAFSRTAIAGKAACRRALAAEIELPLADDEILLGVVARMTGQKGLDLVADIVPSLHSLRMRLVVLGAGDPALEDRFRYLATTFRDHVHVRVGFDLGFARRIYAGSDAFLMPSRFEPCGLGQLYAMRYGTLPIVNVVGGLADTVDDGVTGFAFSPARADSLLAALGRLSSAARTARTRMRTAAMARDSSWTASAAAYLALYEQLSPPSP